LNIYRGRAGKTRFPSGGSGVMRRGVGSMARRNRYDREVDNRKNAEVSYTTEGSTVRVTSPYEIPEREREETPGKKGREEQRRANRIRRNQEKALQMTPFFVFFLSLAAASMLFISVRYLRVESSITATLNRIEKKELELESLKRENAVLESKIRTYMDLDYIYQVATEELGMSYPDEDQVLYYEKTESEYVRQYDKIP